MSRHRCRAAFGLILVAFLAAPGAGQNAPQFKADLRMQGGGLDGPTAGVIYFNGQRSRLDLTVDGAPMVILIQPGSGSLTVLMPNDKMVMEMPAMMAPVSPPPMGAADPANPCSGGRATGCVSLGEEDVNGYATRKWQYVVDGEEQTSWIATQLRFPVRVIDASGTQTDFTNVVQGPQPASLFEVPADYQSMGGLGMMGAGRGAGAGPGAGSFPMGPRGMANPSGGLDPAMMAAMGLDSAAIAMAMASGATTNSSVWEAVDYWVVDVTVTSTGLETETFATEPPGQRSWRHTLTYTGTVPFIYGTPAVGAAVGPAWQLLPGLGSPRAMAESYVFRASTELTQTQTNEASCPVASATRIVTESRGTAEARIPMTDPAMGLIQARFELSGDLSTYKLGVAIGAEGRLEAETVSTTLPSCGEPGSSSTSSATQTPSFNAALTLEGPVPAAPGTISGERTMPLRLEYGRGGREVEATVRWTLRPVMK